MNRSQLEIYETLVAGGDLETLVTWRNLLGTCWVSIGGVKDQS